jgi:pimeloyl-ACP methyl ester carboxylesterase
MKSRPLAVAGVAAGLLLILWMGACALLWSRQGALLFAAVPLPQEAVLVAGEGIAERHIEVPGASLSVMELRLPNPDGVVFYLHGNGGNLRQWFVNADFYRQANYDLVMMDYRGYGKSTGRISSEAQLHADVEAVWRSVAERYTGRRIVIYGRSLGTALAAHLAAKLQPDLTVLVSPFVSILSIAREQYPWAPAFLVRFALRTDLVLPGIHTPVLLLHGDRDDFIPPAASRKLQSLAPAARLVIVPGAGHNDIHQFDAYRQAFRQALDGLRINKP